MICGEEKYRFYISIDGGSSYTEVFLNNNPKVDKKQETDEIFYRASCDEWVLQSFKNDSMYSYLISYLQNPCTSVFEIKMQVRTSTETLYTGVLKASNVNVDEVNGILNISPVNSDDYTWWDEDKDTVISASVLFKTVTYATTSVTYEEQVQRVGIPPSRPGMDLCGIDALTQIYTFKQQRIPFAATGYAQGNGVFGDDPSATNCPEDLYYKAQCTPETLPAETLGNLFMRFDDLVNYVLLQLGTGLTLSSTYLNNATNPITGSANQLSNIVIGKLADVQGITGKVREFTFAGLMSLIKTLNCFWWVDGTELKIEHIKTINDAKTNGIDLTNSKYDKYQVLSDVNGVRTDNKYRFDIKIPYREEFAYTEGDDRIGTIQYNNGLADKSKVTKYELRNYVADVIKLINFPDSMDEDNYIWLVCDSSYQILEEFNGTVNILNYHLSWEKILNNYWTYYRWFYTGEINGSAKSFDTIKPIKIQENLEFPDLDDIYDAEKYITTNMGNGEVDSFVLDTKNGFITVTLKQLACEEP